MATIYKRNAQQVYKRPIYTLFLPWLILALATAGLITLINSLVSVVWLQTAVYFLWSLVVVMTAVRSYAVYRGIRSAGSIRRYRVEQRSAKDITRNLLATMTLNRQQDSPHVTVPDVTVIDRTPSHLTVKIEKLAGMYDLDRLAEDVSGSFRGLLANYAVTSSRITTNGNEFVLTLEDVESDRTWRPATLEDIKVEKYIIKLQEGLKVNLSERAHIAIWGKTGSKKTTVLFGIILQLFSMGADVRFIDGKDEFSAFSGFYPREKIVSDPDEVFEQLESILAIIKERQKIMADEVQKRGKMGLKASEVGLRPVVLIADEIGSIVALMDSKQSKKFVADLTAIIQRGRSVGVSVIASTQDPSTDTLPQKIRQQFSTKILLGSANSDIQRMAFGEVPTAGNVEDFRGFYICDGLTNQPMKFYVCDLYSHGFNELAIFEKGYQLGLKR